MAKEGVSPRIELSVRLSLVGMSKLTVMCVAAGKVEVGSGGQTRKEMTDGRSVKRQRMIRFARSMSSSDR